MSKKMAACTILTKELREELAKGIIRAGKDDPGTVFSVAKRLLGDVGKALWITDNWVADQDLVNRITEIEDSEEAMEELLPTKIDVLKNYWAMATNPAEEASARISATDKFAEIRGYKPKKDDSAGSIINNVLVVPAAQKVEDWTANAKKQQTGLIEMGRKVNEELHYDDD